MTTCTTYMYVTHYTLWLEQNYSGVVTKAKNRYVLLLSRVTTARDARVVWRYDACHVTRLATRSWRRQKLALALGTRYDDMTHAMSPDWRHAPGASG